MGTTRIKVIDLSSSEKAVKTSRKRAEKVAFKEHQEESDQNIQKPQTAADSKTRQLQVAKPTDEIAPTTSPTTQKPKNLKTHKHHLGKKYQKARQLVEDKIYTQSEAFALLPKTSITKFDPTVEIHLNVADKNVKGSVTFPYLKVAQKQKKYLIFSDQPAGEAGKQLTINDKHIVWANEKTISNIENGTLKPIRDFDTVIASPKFMPSLAKIAKILGPKGLMPNPKNGTITDNIQKTLVGSGDKDQYNFKCDPTSAVIHTKIGKLSQKEEELKANLKALVLAIGTAKIRGATLTTTMGPGIRLDTSSSES